MIEEQDRDTGGGQGDRIENLVGIDVLDMV